MSPEPEGESAFAREDEMYQPLVDALERDAGDGSIIFETASLRKRGKWQNPDVTELRVDVFPRLRQRRTLVISYEAKLWGDGTSKPCLRPLPTPGLLMKDSWCWNGL